MTAGAHGRGWAQASAATLVVLLAITVGIFVLGKYDSAHLDWPIGYGADAAQMYGVHGTELAGHPFASRTAAPFEHPLRLVPDTLQCFAFSMECTILRAAGWFTADAIRIVNIDYFLVYYLTGLAALYALRRSGIGWVASGAGATLFALLPYHFMRSVNHLNVGDYALVPIFMLICAWIHDEGQDAARDGAVLATRFPTRRMALPLVIAVTWGLTNDYYAFMFLMFAGFSALLGYNRGRKLRPLYLAVGIAVALALAFGVRTALVHASWGHYAGISFGTYQLTGYGEDEMYPLKLIQLILPGPDNRLHALAEMNHAYSAGHPLVNENAMDALGLALAIALLALLVKALLGRPDQPPRDRFLARNLLFALLLGAMGGIGTLISELSWNLLGARFPLSQARGWNRVYVFLAFIVVWFLAGHLDRWLQQARIRGAGGGRRRLAYPLAVSAAVILVALAMYEQVPPVPSGWLRGNALPYLADQAFFGKLDRHYGRDYRVFYWPAMVPWGGNYAQEYYTVAYHPLLASRKLVTSYGAPPNTVARRWLLETAAQPPAEMLHSLCRDRFDGVLVFKLAIRPQDAPMAQYLQAHALPLQESSQYAYYSLASLCKA